MMKLKLLAAATSAALFAVGGAVAQTSTPSTSFSALDKNNDGNISQQEWNDHYRMGASSGASGGTSSETQDAMRRGPTSRSGEPAVGGPRTGDEARGGAAAGATGTTAGEGARSGYPTSRMGEPQQGGPRVSEQHERATSGATTSGAPGTDAGDGARRGYPTAPNANPSVGGPATK